MNIETIITRHATSKGLTVKAYPNGQFQILGGVRLVNYYPESRKRSAYVQGMAKAHHNVTPEEAIEFAFNPKPLRTKTKRKNKGNRARKLRMFEKNPVCHICNTQIASADDATIDHVIPLSKGGLDHHNNRALAHMVCNKAKGSDMPKGKRDERSNIAN